MFFAIWGLCLDNFFLRGVRGHLHNSFFGRRKVNLTENRWNWATCWGTTTWRSLLRNSNCAEIPPTLEHIFCCSWFPKKNIKIEDCIGKIPRPQTFTNIHVETQTGFLRFSPYKSLPCNRLNEACWLQGSNVTEFESPMAIAGPRACDEPQVVSLKEMQLDAVLNCAKARMANLGDETWRVWLSEWLCFSLTFSCCRVKWPLRVCEDIKTFVSVSPPQKCQTFGLKCLKDPRLHGACRIISRVFPVFFGEKELVAPEFMVKSDAVECQMCLAWTWGHWGHWVDDPTILLGWKSLGEVIIISNTSWKVPNDWNIFSCPLKVGMIGHWSIQPLDPYPLQWITMPRGCKATTNCSAFTFYSLSHKCTLHGKNVPW